MRGDAADGKQAILSIIDAPQWFGEIAVFDGLPRTHDVLAEVRLARRLLMLAQSGSQNQPGQMLHQGQPVVLPISQQQLGMMLSLSRQTVNQLLHGLQAQGIVQVAYGRIELRDMAALAGVAELSRHELQMLEQVLPGSGLQKV